MASPKTMWSGSIELGLLNIPITLGKAYESEAETGITTVCSHGAAAGASPITRGEWCPQCKGKPQHKMKAVAVEGGYRILEDAEVAHIENSTKTPSLIIKDVQPLGSLPIIFSVGMYYVRHDEKSKIQPKAFNRLVMALGRTNYGLVCQWGNQSKQKLCVISAERGVLILRVIPHLTEVRPASSKERLHFAVPSDETETSKMVELLDAVRNPNGFQYGDYVDRGLALRQAAVQRILDGESMPEPDTPEPEEIQTNIFDALEAAIAEAKEKASV